MGFIYNKDLIGCMNVFESITKVKAKDCYDAGNDLIFIVESINMPKAIGKGGSKAKLLAKLLRKSIKIVEYSNDPSKFVANFISPIEGKVYKESESVIAIHLSSDKDKRMVIGRDKKNIGNMQKIVSNYFNASVKVM